MPDDADRVCVAIYDDRATAVDALQLLVQAGLLARLHDDGGLFHLEVPADQEEQADEWLRKLGPAGAGLGKVITRKDGPPLAATRTRGGLSAGAGARAVGPAAADSLQAPMLEEEVTSARGDVDAFEYVPLPRAPVEKDTDAVDCSVFAPPRVAAGDAVIVHVYLHLVGQPADAQRLAAEHDPEARRLMARSLEVELRRGDALEVELSLPGCAVDEPVQQLMWAGETVGAQFGVTAPTGSAPRRVVGTARVYCEGAPVGYLKFQLEVGGPRTAQGAKSARRGEEARRYEYAFISYSSRDRDEVLKRVQVLERWGVNYFQDLLTLEPGQRWERKLYEHIDRCDVFLLFWSEASRGSKWVEKELLYALSRQKADARQAPEIVPIILEGPPVPPPPEYLQDVHFNDRLLYFRSRPAAAAARPPSRLGPALRAARQGYLAAGLAGLALGLASAAALAAAWPWDQALRTAAYLVPAVHTLGGVAGGLIGLCVRLTRGTRSGAP